MTSTTTSIVHPSTSTSPDDPGLGAAADTHAGDAGPHGPFGRVVAGSVLTGLAAAGVLTLGLFRGGEEHVITGTGLFGFALGWLVLALASHRFTNRPQRWAFVPAAAMAATGAALLAFAPGDDALTTAGWVWPPVLLVLAGWVGARVHRAVPGRPRWLLYPVALALAVAALGGFFESVELQRDASNFAMPGRQVDVGGRGLHLECAGDGGPTVVFENGLGETSPIWERFTTAPALADVRRCTYDRAGQGWSDDAPAPADAVAVAEDLHALLAAAGEAGPFVLAGHSAGGPYVMTYAARYPDDVAGLVLLDASSPRQFEEIPSFPGIYAMARGVYGLMQPIARTGLLRMAPASFFSALEGPAAGEVRAFASSPRQMRNARDEHSRYHEAFAQGQALTSLGDKPLAVVTATQKMSGGWLAAQRRLATLSTNRRHDLAATTHVGLIDTEAGSRTAISAVQAVVDAVRTGAPLR